MPSNSLILSYIFSFLLSEEIFSISAKKLYLMFNVNYLHTLPYFFLYVLSLYQEIKSNTTNAIK